MSLRRILALAAALAVAGGAASCAAAELRVLLIGNSYTAQSVGELEGFLGADVKVRAELVCQNCGLVLDEEFRVSG